MNWKQSRDVAGDPCVDVFRELDPNHLGMNLLLEVMERGGQVERVGDNDWLIKSLPEDYES